MAARRGQVRHQHKKVEQVPGYNGDGLLDETSAHSYLDAKKSGTWHLAVGT